MPERDAATPCFDAVVVVEAGAEQMVGGLCLLERVAFGLARAGCRRLLLVGARPGPTVRLPDVAIAWSDADTGIPADWLHAARTPIVVTETATVSDPPTIVALLRASGPPLLAAPEPAVLWRVAAPSLSKLLPSGEIAVPLRPPSAASVWEPPPEAVLHVVRDAASRRDAERALYARLGRGGDGWFTRLVDRRLSRLLTRLLVPTGISPNQVTVASIAIGIAGGCCFAAGTPGAAMAGALLFLASTIIDGCDGEIARLTFRESAFGARLDILGDNVVHLFLFGGIAAGLYRRSGEPLVALLGVALVIGVVLAMATVYFCIVRQPPNRSQRVLYEAFASREFAYLLVGLTLAGRLDWFLWMSALGTYVFAAGLLLLHRRSRVD